MHRHGARPRRRHRPLAGAWASCLLGHMLARHLVLLVARRHGLLARSTYFWRPPYLFFDAPLPFFGDPFTFFWVPFICRKTQFICRKTQETILFRIFRKEDVFDHTVSTKVGSLASSGTAGICTFRWRAK